jgi:hypothetical protein
MDGASKNADAAASLVPRRILNDLIRERMELQRSAGADPGLVEANRLAIAYWARRVWEPQAVEQREI